MKSIRTNPANHAPEGDERTELHHHAGVTTGGDKQADSYGRGVIDPIHRQGSGGTAKSIRVIEGRA